MSRSLDKYDPLIRRYLEEIERTPTGRPLIEWVREHQPDIEFGNPRFASGAFTYPWPIRKIVLTEAFGEEWERETIAHELAHMVRWSGHLVGSLQQEYDAYRIGAQVRCEHAGEDWRDPKSKAARWYPELFGPDASPEKFQESLKDRDPFYAELPWKQPSSILEVIRSMARQASFAVHKTLVSSNVAHQQDDDQSQGRA
jgi:hypothetical protein